MHIHKKKTKHTLLLFNFESIRMHHSAQNLKLKISRSSKRLQNGINILNSEYCKINILVSGRADLPFKIGMSSLKKSLFIPRWIRIAPLRELYLSYDNYSVWTDYCFYSKSIKTYLGTPILIEGTTLISSPWKNVSQNVIYHYCIHILYTADVGRKLWSTDQRLYKCANELHTYRGTYVVWNFRTPHN